MLDAGCGQGRTCRYLERAGFEAVGIELDSRTLRKAQEAERYSDSSSPFILADGRELCFRDQSFDYVISFASTLSEKHRLWMRKEDRVAFINEMVRVTRPGGWIIVNFVHRYWNLMGFFKFIKNYWMWIAEKASSKKIERGDYVEKIGRTPIRFHAFTIREAKALFPLKDLRLSVWRRGRGMFTDWFFVVAEKRDFIDR